MRELASTGSIVDVRVQQAEKGLVIAFNVLGNSPSNERVLGQARSGVRYFQSFDGAAAMLQSMGIMEFTATTTDWIPRTAKGVSVPDGKITNHKT